MIPIRSNWMNGYVILQKLILFLQYDVRCVFLDKSVSIVTIAHKTSVGPRIRTLLPKFSFRSFFMILEIRRVIVSLFFSLISYYIIYKRFEIFTSFLSDFHTSRNIVALSTTSPTSLHQPLNPKSLRNSITVVVGGL